MSSQINTQVATVQRILAPSATGIKTNSSPSIPADHGSLAVDITDANHLYVGDGTNWRNVSGGIDSVTVVDAPGQSIVLAGQPSLMNCHLTIQAITIGTTIQVSLSIFINQTINSTGAGDWLTAPGIIPVGLRPSGPLFFPYTMLSTAGLVTTYFEVNPSNSGVVLIHSPSAAGDITFYSLSCVYNL